MTALVRATMQPLRHGMAYVARRYKASRAAVKQRDASEERSTVSGEPVWKTTGGLKSHNR